MNASYLLIDLATISIPLIASFHPKLRFDKTWYAFWPGIVVMMLVFIPWDAYFTAIGVWGFTEQYLLGIHVLYLPVEEWLFFICIPYACVFTYHCIKLFVKPGKYAANFILLFLVMLFAASGCLLFYDLWYPFATFLGIAVLTLLLLFTQHYDHIVPFTASFVLLMVPFYLVDGRLTGTGLDSPIVWYNPEEFLGYRWGTIPYEDIAYAYLMLLITASVYEYLLSRKSIKTEPGQ